MVGALNTEPIPADTLEALYQSDKKVVSFRARNSELPEQHPTGLHDRIDTESDGIRRMAETYVELVEDEPGPQIVLTWDRPIICPGVMRVVGEVDFVNLGGPEGTRSSYARPWVKVHQFECEKP